MTIRNRINTARKLDPQLCLSKVGKSIWSMGSVSDPANHIQVEVMKYKHITSVGKNGKISHAQYICKVHRINPADGWIDYFGPRRLEYAVAAILGEASNAKRKVIFYKDLSSVMLKKKIQDVSMIEVVVGKERIWGVVYNELT